MGLYTEYAKQGKQTMANQLWDTIGDTKVAEHSTLQGNGWARGSEVCLPTGDWFSLKEADKDWDGEDIGGWRFEIDGQKYLVIND